MLAAVLGTGWSVVDRDPLVWLADANAVAEVDGVASAARAALLAVVPDAAAADRAYDDGATHVMIGEPAGAALLQSLRFAGRYARRLRGFGRDRRAGDGGVSAIDQFFAHHGESPSTMARVALTRFDVVNEAFGRAAGDALMMAAAARIGDVLPDDAVIERGDGATFVIAFAGDEAGTQRVIGEIENALTRAFEADGQAVNLGARIGVARRVAGEDLAHLTQRALDALSDALMSDGATTLAADEPREAPMLRLAADLHRAIDGGEIGVLFQPQVRAATGEIVGVEALARWEHPELGPLGADTLFAAAERADLGIALSEHIQALALTRVAAWPDTLAHLRVAINVTAADIARPEFARRFLARLDASGVARNRVTVEITETGLIGELEAAAAHLVKLRTAGCRIAIDDFGTGYSSLAYLKALPLDYLKIDRSLAQDIAGSERDRIVVRAVLTMAWSLGLETIAEGVETAEQRDLLAAESCTYFQGFLFAGPVDSAALAGLMGGS
ncbi:GGDEF domain-containing phosphodiesterase [Sphingomonas sp. SUN019]|uniref:putative bifunctional diguanylate cyclase/phosphodiesterase n=1 Tax=Sphingomonas sp. SUN019 TaxID=2937788 RepID=UPI002164D10E|nr:GGDEF domain-containing phosphodiesterase [Sphingomonas sp. SUN019]UVO49551.1 GGDEF domain-containing phosphodiesterase [Sphingomonas sp. SUN019]